MPRLERFLAAQKAMMRLWVRDGLFRYVRVPTWVLRPDINTKSDHTIQDFKFQAYWCQRGEPHPDDTVRRRAVALIEPACGNAKPLPDITIATAGIAGLVEWLDPFAEEWEQPHGDGGGTPSAAGGDDVVALKRDLKKLRRAAARQQRDSDTAQSTSVRERDAASAEAAELRAHLVTQEARAALERADAEQKQRTLTGMYKAERRKGRQ